MEPEQLAVDWLVWQRDVRGLSQNTLNMYNQVLRFWLVWCEDEGVDPLRPTLGELEDFMVRKRARVRKGAPASQAADASVLKLWFEWMKQREFITGNPAEDLKGPKVERMEGRPIEDEHWEIIWDSDLPPRLRASLGLGFYVGLRRDEIWSLQSDQITATRLVRFKRKGGGQDTTDWLAMASVFETRLPNLLPMVEEFSGPLMHCRWKYQRIAPWSQPEGLYYRMRSLCEQLHIPQYTPHQLRHSTATNLLRAGVPHHLVMRMMNHSSFDITMRYVRAQGTDLKDWLQSVS